MSAVLESPVPCLRPMREDDVKEVLVIEQQCYEFPWSEGIYNDCLRVGYSCWVLERDKHIDGYGILTVAGGESHILNLCICPEAQGNGFGRLLLNYLLDLAIKHNADTTFLEVRQSNLSAIQLYRTAGFSEVGSRRAYYPAESGREDAVIMALDLPTWFVSNLSGSRS